jgi:hypothetical protein
MRLAYAYCSVIAQEDLGGLVDGGAGREADDGAVALRRGAVDGESGGGSRCQPATVAAHRYWSLLRQCRLTPVKPMRGAAGVESAILAAAERPKQVPLPCRRFLSSNRDRRVADRPLAYC